MMETILGIHDGHNAAAALLSGGRILGAVQEERLTRIKNQGGIPYHAINDVLSAAEGPPPKISKVALNGVYGRYDHWDREPLLETYERSDTLVEGLKHPLKGTFID